MHTEITKIEVLYLCTTISAVNFILKANGSIGEGAKFRLSGCAVDLNGAPSKACEPNNEGKEPGVVVTKPLHGLLISENLISIVPDVGEVFGTIEMSKECAIGSKISVGGTLRLKDSQGLLKSHLVKHLLEVGSEAEGTALWTVNNTFEHATFILGSRWAFLTGTHAGMKFGGDPA